jgi:hypothetical protein
LYGGGRAGWQSTYGTRSQQNDRFQLSFSVKENASYSGRWRSRSTDTFRPRLRLDKDLTVPGYSPLLGRAQRGEVKRHSRRRERLPVGGRRSAVYQLYEKQQEGPTLGIRLHLGSDKLETGGYRRWVQPEVVSRDDTFTLTDESAVPIPGKRRELSHGELGDRYILHRLETAIDVGWSLFESREYLKAYDMFKIADAASMSLPERRPKIKLAMIYAAVASGQYAQAAYSLAWLLRRNPQGELPDPFVLTHVADIRERYATSRDFERHIELAQRLSAQEPTPAMVALRSLLLWSRTDDAVSRQNALFSARRLAETNAPQPWPELVGLMQAADQAGRDDAGDDAADGSMSTTKPVHEIPAWLQRDNGRTGP